MIMGVSPTKCPDCESSELVRISDGWNAEEDNDGLPERRFY